MTPASWTRRRFKYACRALQMNPATEPQQIVRLRQLALDANRMNRASADNQAAPPVSIAAIRRRFEQIRTEFWHLETADFIAQLDSLAADKFPVLSANVKRAKQLADVKSQFLKFTSETECNVNFIETFKQLFTLPPRLAGHAKEKYLRSLTTKPELKSVKKTISIIEQEHPDLYAIESDWLRQIQCKKYRRSTKRPNV